MNYTENMKLWLRELYDKEIEEAKGAASNEHLWALGSDGESAIQHEMYAEEQREYIKILEELKEAVK